MERSWEIVATSSRLYISMTVGRDLHADLKKLKTRLFASSRLAEFGGTFTLRSVNAILVSQLAERSERKASVAGSVFITVNGIYRMTGQEEASGDAV